MSDHGKKHLQTERMTASDGTMIFFFFFRRGWGAVRGRRLRSIRESVFIDCLCGCLAFLAGWTFPYCASSYWCLLILRDENSHISWILTFALRTEGKWTAERQWACGAGWQDPPL